MKAKKKTRQRPGPKPKPAAEKMSAFVGIKMTQAERRRLEAEAKRLGITLSQLLMKPWRRDKET